MIPSFDYKVSYFLGAAGSLPSRVSAGNIDFSLVPIANQISSKISDRTLSKKKHVESNTSGISSGYRKGW